VTGSHGHPGFKDGKQLREAKFISAGRTARSSDGAAAEVAMEEAEASKRGRRPPGTRRDMAMAALFEPA